MISLKHLLFLVVFILLYGCTEEHITNQSNLGNIKGRVVAQDQTGYVPLKGISVFIPGTPVYAYTDSLGNFLLINLPAGTYDLKVHSYNYGLTEYINNISVSPGNTTIVPDIIFDLSSSTNPTFLEALYMILPNYYDIYLGMNDTSVVDLDDVGGDSVSLQGRLSRDYYSQAGDTALTVEYDSDLYYTETSKRIFYFHVPVKEKFCQLRIWEGHSTQPNNAQFISTILVTDIIYVLIDLDWSTSYGSSAGDFDIHLINNELQDSCWYKNPNPDWGIIGFEEDNPDLDDGTNPNGYYYAYEDLSIDFTPDGTYRLKVVYFSNILNENIQITPEIDLNIDGMHYSYTAPSSMSIGQVWTVLEFNIPSKTVVLINTIEGPMESRALRK
jgi:hypothetical protein